MKNRLIVDITPLQHGFFPNAARSGIFFTVKNVLSQLLLRDDLELFFNITADDDFPTVDRIYAVIRREFPDQESRIVSRIVSERKSGMSVVYDRMLAKISASKERFHDNRLFFFLLRAAHFSVCRVLRRIPLFRGPYYRLEFGTENHPPQKPRRFDPDNASWLSLMLTPPAHIRKLIPPDKQYLLLYDTIPLQISDYTSHLDGWFGDLVRNLSDKENYLAISEFTRNEIIRFFPFLKQKKIPVVLLAAAEYFTFVDDPDAQQQVREKYHIPGGKKIFLSHCSLAEHKNLDMLVKAFAEFYRTDSEWIIVFSGSNSQNKIARLTKLADSCSLPAAAYMFTGYVDDADLPVLYSVADVFCFISLYEGFGLPVLEAMQCGCPCLVGKVASLPEVGGDAVCWVDPRDQADVLRGLHLLASDPELRAELRRRGLERARLFSWRKCADEIISAMFSLQG